MPATREQFQTRLTDSGIMSLAEIEAFEQSLPEESQGGAPQELAEALVAAERLTPFQAEILLGDTAGPLRLGNYLLLDRVGSGGMGHVHKAIHERMNRIVALKVLPPMLAMDPDLVARFRREVEAAARLHHENIVTAYDADEAEGVHFLVMELVDGRDLGAFVDAEGPLSVDDALEAIAQAAKGLGYAHAQGVLHRDVKPANLLREDSGRVKILDMGLARLDTSEGLTTTGDVIGTAATMAPEQGENTGQVDERSDVYGLGCTLYFLLTGHHLYEGDSALQVLLSHARDPIPDLRKARPDVPADVVKLFESMVQKDPADRLPDMAAVGEAVRAIQAGDAPPAPPSIVPPARRRAPWAMLGIAILIGILAWSLHDADPPVTSLVPVVHVLRDHEATVHDVVFHPDGERLLTASSDRTVGIWNLQEGKLQDRLTGHGASVRAVVVTQDGRTVCTASEDGEIRIWDLETRTARKTIPAHQSKVRALALAPDDTWFASVSKDGTLKRWSLPEGDLIKTADDHDEWVGSNQGFLGLAIRSDGTRLATAAFDRTIRLWNPDSWTVVHKLGPHPSDVGFVSWTRDGRYLMYDLEVGEVRVMDGDGRQDIGRLIGHEDWVYAIDSCPSCPVVATGSQDATVRLWNVASGEELAVLEGHEWTVGAVGFSPDGRLLATGSGDETVRIWDVSRLTRPAASGK